MSIKKHNKSPKNTDLTKSADMTLRNAYRYRKKDGLPIEDELNEELAKRFPGYNKETKTFGNVSERKRITDWTKSSDASLRVVYRYKTKRNLPIDENLNKELAKRFLNYDKTTKTFTNSSLGEYNKDFTKYTDASLRVIFGYKKKRGQPIEDELNEELAKRFPGYNKKTKTFGNASGRKRIADWTKSSDAALRMMYHYRKKKNLPIEDGLNDKLAKRFPGYNKETKTFGNVSESKRITDWAKSSDASLRVMYRYRKKKNLPIEDGLNDKLAERFPNYNKETQTFYKNPIIKRDKNWTKLTNSALRNIHHYKTKNNMTIEKELNEELAKRFHGYNKETKTFGNASRRNRITDWTKSSDNSLRKTFSNRKKKNWPIEKELNEELAKRFPSYNKETKTFGNSYIKHTKINWSKSANKTLRKAYSYRKTKGLPIDEKLNKELAIRFPGYNKETKTFGNASRRNRITDWTKSSDNSLRKAYIKRKKKNLPIENELNEELAKRFQGYDKETKTFGKYVKKIKNKDWTKSSDKSLRLVYHYRKKKNLPIENELNEELEKRFPNYNKETQTFINYAKKIKNKDWAKITDKSLRFAYHYRKKKNLPIEDELNEELTKRFHSYDKETKILRRNRITDWTKSSDNSLRRTFSNRKKKNLPIENELNEELAKRFPNYNKETKIFDNASVIRNNKDWAKATDNSLRIAYHYRKKKNLPIEDELNEELTKRFHGYDKETLTFYKKNTTIKKDERNLILPLFYILTAKNKYSLYINKYNKKVSILNSAAEPYELCLFDEKLEMAIIRKQSSKKSNSLYVIDLRNGKKFNTSIHLTQRVLYSAKNHEILLASEKNNYYTVVSRANILQKITNIPLYTETIKAGTMQKHTVIINKEGKEIIYPIIKIENQDNMDKLNLKITNILNGSDITTLKPSKQQSEKNEKILNSEAKKENVITTKNSEKKLETKTQENQIIYKNIIVTVQQTKITQEGTYNDIFINNKKLLSNHLNTEIKLFGDDTILAIHGTLKGNINYPDKPIWMVYDTNLRSIAPQVKQMFSKYFTYIQNILNYGDNVKIDLVPKSTTLFTKERLAHLAKGKRFLVEKSK